MTSNKKLVQSWRWYGPNDPVSLQDVKQAGASNIVTALHHIPHGEIWPIEEIKVRKELIEEAGLRWTVVESVPVHEAIKTNRADAASYLKNYKQTLRNLGICGIKTICYNFMPVLDWTRTQLDLTMKDGSKALYFNWTDLAVFDLFILKRAGAENDYPATIIEQAKVRFESYNQAELDKLAEIVLMGIPSEDPIGLGDLRDSISIYETIGTAGLRTNLLRFLSEIADVCTEFGIRMTIHPDDPPYPILGLPRIVSSKEDLLFIIEKEPRDFNGICFCTGSLGAGVGNDVPDILKEVKHKVFFAHLRNVKKDAEGNFYEADHLDGDVDMVEVVKLLSKENQLRELAIPFRPDHGHQMLDDLNKVSNPGYSAIGRLRGLAELRGVELAVLRFK